MSQAQQVSAPQPVPAVLSYTLTEAARVTGLSIATLRRHAKAARLRFFKVGGRTLVCAASLRSLLGAEG